MENLSDRELENSVSTLDELSLLPKEPAGASQSASQAHSNLEEISKEEVSLTLSNFF